MSFYLEVNFLFHFLYNVFDVIDGVEGLPVHVPDESHIEGPLHFLVLVVVGRGGHHHRHHSSVPAAGPGTSAFLAATRPRAFPLAPSAPVALFILLLFLL